MKAILIGHDDQRTRISYDHLVVDCFELQLARSKALFRGRYWYLQSWRELERRRKEEKCKERRRKGNCTKVVKGVGREDKTEQREEDEADGYCHLPDCYVLSVQYNRVVSAVSVALLSAAVRTVHTHTHTHTHTHITITFPINFRNISKQTSIHIFM